MNNFANANFIGLGHLKKYLLLSREITAAISLDSLCH